MTQDNITARQIIENCGLQCPPEQIEQLVVHFESENYYEFNRLIVHGALPGAMEILSLEEVLKNIPEYYAAAAQKVTHSMTTYGEALTKNKNLLDTPPESLTPEGRKELDNALENLKEEVDFYEEAAAKFHAGKRLCLKMKDPGLGDKEAIFTANEKNLSIMILRMMV